jgi:hypothetical protein
MTHIVTIEDEDTGDIVDVSYYCSDTCAKTDSYYQGWNGCHEAISAPCAHCGAITGWLAEEAS